MRLQFLGAAETTSGSCYLLNFAEHNVLIDCGLFQGPEELKQRNYGDFPFEPEEIDAVILTHAHIDHSGLLPKLVKWGFNGSIFTTGVTVDLCEIMLADSGYIQETEVERKNRKLSRRGKKLLEPIYTVQDARESMKHFRRMIYDEEVSILPGLRVRFRDAGHILGAAIVELWVTENEETTKIVFSGDLGNLNQPIVQDPTFITAADILVIESTYGTRLHEERDTRFEYLAEMVNKTMQRGGNLLIPAFALGRTQDLLYSLRILQDEGKIPPLTIYIDSPLASAATEVFMRHSSTFDYKTRSMLAEGRSPFASPGVHYTETVEESMRLNQVRGGLVIIAGSGMADAGRIKHHLKHNLWRKETGVLLVGYQAQGTLGRRLQDGAEEVRIHGEPVKVKADVQTITGFSAHGDQAALLNWLRRFNHIGRVFVTHGEKESCHGFAELISEKLKVPAIVPKLDEIFEFNGSKTFSTWEKDYDDLYIEEEFSGVIQVMKDKEIKFRGSYGLAERKYAIKNTFYTLFNLGLGREFFAQLALECLVERGELIRDDVGDYNLEPIWEEKLASLTNKPPWETVYDEIISPAELNQTAYYYLDQLPAAAAIGYTRTRSKESVENIYAILGSGLAPQLFSTVHDLTRLWSTLGEGQLIKPENLEKFLYIYAKRDLGEDYYQIEGSAPGARFMLGGSFKQATSIVVLSNGEDGVTSVINQLNQLSFSGR